MSFEKTIGISVLSITLRVCKYKIEIKQIVLNVAPGACGRIRDSKIFRSIHTIILQ